MPCKDNIHYVSVTQGDPLYDVIQFNDEHGNPKDLTGYSFALNIKYTYADSVDLFALSMVAGLGFVNNDPTLGQLYYFLNSSDTNSIIVSTTALPGIPVPYTQLVSDLKITPPEGVQVVAGNGTRPKIFIKVEADVS